MDISLIICTCNRVDILPKLFENLEKIFIPPQISWEIIIVDNASNDNTPAIIKNNIAQKLLPIIHLREERKGKSKALNLALEKARGQLLVFADDDLNFTPGWLFEYFTASLKYPHVDGFLGKVLPWWEGGKPPEWAKNLVSPSPIDGVINRRDHGEDAIFFDRSVVPPGCNAALRRRAVDKIGRFREDIGPGTHFPFAEDTEYFKRLYLYGGQFLYIPAALVYHRNTSDRMTKGYFLKWTFHCARSEVQIHNYDEMKKCWGIPIYLFRKLFISLFRLLLISEKNYFINNLQPLVKCVGEITGHLQKKKRSVAT